MKKWILYNQIGKFTIRDMGEQMQNITKLGPLDRVVSMIPGMANMMPQGVEKDSNKQIKKIMILLNSMTDAELDGGKNWMKLRLIE